MAKSEITKVLSERLEELTERKRDTNYKLSDKKQAEQMGIPYPTFNKYKHNTAECPISTVVKMAKYYNVSADYLLGISGNFTTDDELKFVCNYTGLSDEAIKHLRHHLMPPKFEHRFFEEDLKIIELEKYVVNNILSCDNFWHIVMRLFALRDYTKDLEFWKYQDFSMFDNADVCRYTITKEIEKISDLFDGRVKKEASNNGDNNPTNK